MIFLAATLWQQIEQWDQWLFIKINSQWTNPFLDTVTPYLRHPILWAPLYFFSALFVFLNFKIKGLWWAVLFLTTIALTDLVGTYIFKHNFQRLRPCSDPDFIFHVRLLLKSCSGYGFISNHAANHFGMAAFFFITFRQLLKNWAWMLFIWAFIIAYAQVYVGTHYPLDVICGAAIGLLFGFFTGILFNKRFGFVTFDNQPVA